MKNSLLMIRALSMNSSPITPQLIFSQENRNRTVKTLADLSPVSIAKTLSKRRAAVLVPLCEHQGHVCLLFTVRAMKLRNNRGQVAFPGGMEDSNDKSLLDTALREVEEEVGLPASRVDIWGSGPSIGREDMTVTPYLGSVGEIDPTMLKINQEEVESVFAAPLAAMCEPKNFATTEFRSKRGNYVMPIFQTRNFKIWGLTAIITHTMLLALLPIHYHNCIQRCILTSRKLPSVVFA